MIVPVDLAILELNEQRRVALPAAKMEDGECPP
jgi:hypothetical protein